MDNRFQNKFQVETTAPAPGSPATTISQTAFLHTLIAGAWLPLQLALISGVLVGLLTAWVTAFYLPNDSLFLSGLFSLLTTLGTWIFFQTQRVRLINFVERISNQDINGDGLIAEAEPTETKHTITVDLRVISKTSDITYRAQFAGISDERMALFARGTLRGRPMTITEWSGKGKPFSRREVEQIMGEMYDRQMVELKNPKNKKDGYVPSKAGWETLRKLKAVIPPPPGSPDVEN